LIKHISRGSIVVEVGDREVTVQSEAYIPGYGSPDYVIASNSIEKWDPPHQDEPFTSQDKDNVLSTLQADLLARHSTFEIE
jgi:hypothetical protein